MGSWRYKEALNDVGFVGRQRGPGLHKIFVYKEIDR